MCKGLLIYYIKDVSTDIVMVGSEYVLHCFVLSVALDLAGISTRPTFLFDCNKIISYILVAAVPTGEDKASEALIASIHPPIHDRTAVRLPTLQPPAVALSFELLLTIEHTTIDIQYVNSINS